MLSQAVHCRHTNLLLYYYSRRWLNNSICSFYSLAHSNGLIVEFVYEWFFFFHLQLMLLLLPFFQCVRIAHLCDEFEAQAATKRLLTTITISYTYIYFYIYECNIHLYIIYFCKTVELERKSGETSKWPFEQNCLLPAKCIQH